MSDFLVGNFFHCKNGTQFRNCLVNANDGDPMTCIMFTDNMKSVYKRNYIVIPMIEQGDFKGAVYKAFSWKRSNEGEELWNNIHKSI